MIEDIIRQKKIKFLALIISIVLILIILIFIFINHNKFNALFNPTYLILDNDLVWKLEEDKWISVDKDTVLKRVNFKIYYNKTNIKEGKINFIGSNSFIKEKGSYKYEEKQFKAAISNGDLKLLDIRKTNINDINSDAYASYIFMNSFDKEDSKKIYKNYYKRIFCQKIKVDINNDKQKENIYVLNSLTKESTSFSYSNISLVINDNIQNILSSSTYYYDIKNILDLDSDNKYEIIVKKAKYKGSNTYCYELYKNVNGKYKKEKECKLS